MKENLLQEKDPRILTPASLRAVLCLNLDPLMSKIQARGSLELALDNGELGYRPELLGGRLEAGMLDDFTATLNSDSLQYQREPYEVFKRYTASYKEQRPMLYNPSSLGCRLTTIVDSKGVSQAGWPIATRRQVVFEQESIDQVQNNNEPRGLILTRAVDEDYDETGQRTQYKEQRFIYSLEDELGIREVQYRTFSDETGTFANASIMPRFSDFGECTGYSIFDQAQSTGQRVQHQQLGRFGLAA